ncbi:sulfate transporter family-domain-containing protein [Zopfochytrium polystomum]|nr:sulfate transporter family-domain-containing protein [Zopfochytrium polystomum]
MMRRKLLVEALHDPGPDYSSHTNAKSDLAMEKLVVNLFSRPRLAASAAKSRFMAFVKSSLPLADQMATYDWKLFGEDLIAAVTVAFVLLPQSIAYAGLAQVDPIQALLSAIFPPVLYVFFGSSRQLSIGPEAMVSVVAGSAIIDYMENNPGTAYTAPQIASALALVVGLMCILLSIMRAGFIDNILSGYLLTGFILGGASLIMVEQLPELLGIDVDLEAQESTINMLIATYHHLGNVKWAVAAISLVNVAFLLGFNHLKHKFGKKIVWLGRAPEILILVVLMIGLSAGLDFHGKGIAVLGTFDNKIKMPSPPPLKFELLKKLIEPAMTITLNGFIECQTVTRDFGLKNGYFPSGDQELFAFGFINFVSAFLGAYPTFGSLPRSRILAQSGARTTLSNAMAGVFVLVALLTMVPVLQHLPRSTLASIVFVAALGLIDTKEIAFVFRLRCGVFVIHRLWSCILTSPQTNQSSPPTTAGLGLKSQCFLQLT